MPRNTEPLDLSTVLTAVYGRVVCPADSPLCMFDLLLMDNQVLMLPTVTVALHSFCHWTETLYTSFCCHCFHGVIYYVSLHLPWPFDNYLTYYLTHFDVRWSEEG